MTIRNGQARHLTWLAAAALLAAAGTGCADGGDDLPDPPGTPPPTLGGPPPAADPTHQEILDTYYGSVEAMVAAQRAGDPEHADLTRYYLDGAQALHNLRNTIRRNEDNEMYYEGSLAVVSAEVVELDLDETPPVATIESCVDYAGYELVHRADQSPVEDDEPLGRYEVTTQAIQGTDGNWYIATNSANWDELC